MDEGFTKAAIAAMMIACILHSLEPDVLSSSKAPCSFSKDGVVDEGQYVQDPRLRVFLNDLRVECQSKFRHLPRRRRRQSSRSRS